MSNIDKQARIAHSSAYFLDALKALKALKAFMALRGLKALNSSKTLKVLDQASYSILEIPSGTKEVHMFAA